MRRQLYGQAGQPVVFEHQSKVSSSHKQTTPWNSQKDDQLESFINQWAPTMSQAYTKYNGKTALKTKLDIKYPKNFA